MTGPSCGMELSASCLHFRSSLLTSSSGWVSSRGGGNGAPGSSRLTSCLISRNRRQTSLPQWVQAHPGADSPWLIRVTCPSLNKCPCLWEWGHCLSVQAWLTCPPQAGSGESGCGGSRTKGHEKLRAKPRGVQFHWSSSPGLVAELEVPYHQSWQTTPPAAHNTLFRLSVSIY